MTDSANDRAARIAQNIVNNHGRKTLAIVLDGLESGRTLRDIAAEVGVSHERVRQWSNDLGQRVSAWTPYLTMRRLARESDR